MKKGRKTQKKRGGDVPKNIKNNPYLPAIFKLAQMGVPISYRNNGTPYVDDNAAIDTVNKGPKHGSAVNGSAVIGINEDPNIPQPSVRTPRSSTIPASPHKRVKLLPRKLKNPRNSTANNPTLPQTRVSVISRRPSAADPTGVVAGGRRTRRHRRRHTRRRHTSRRR
jgi:hypothetical protein